MNTSARWTAALVAIAIASASGVAFAGANDAKKGKQAKTPKSSTTTVQRSRGADGTVDRTVTGPGGQSQTIDRTRGADGAVDATVTGRKGGTTTVDRARVKASFVSADRIASFTTDAESTSRRAALGPLRAGKFSLGLLFPTTGRARGRRAAGLARLRVVVHARCARPAQARRRRGRDRNLRYAFPGVRDPLGRVPRLDSPGSTSTCRRARWRASASARGAAFAGARGGRHARACAPRQDDRAHGHGGVRVDLELLGRAFRAQRRVDRRRGSRRVAGRAIRPSRSCGHGDELLQRARGRERTHAFHAGGERGRLAFRGKLATNPFALDGELEATALALVSAKPYFEPRVEVVVTGGTLDARGRVAIATPANGPVRARWQGAIAIADFASLDRPTSSDLARWRRLALEGMRVSTAPLDSPSTVALEDFQARVILHPDATLNVARLLAPQRADAAPALSPASASVPAPATPGEPLPIAIGRIELARGGVDFSDLFVRPNYRANLTGVCRHGLGRLSATETPGDVFDARRGAVEITPRRSRSAAASSPSRRTFSLDLAGARDATSSCPPLEIALCRPSTPATASSSGEAVGRGLATSIARRPAQRRATSLVLDQLDLRRQGRESRPRPSCRCCSRWRC